MVNSLDEKFDSEPYGKKNTKRLTIDSAEEILYKPFKCLDHGFVRLVDYIGGDSAVVDAARVSYGRGTRKTSENKNLIRYLMRHKHTSPFEMVELKFHAKMPIFVARQWIRHRTANVNEISARYSILDNEFYLPEPSVLGVQAKNNKQGRGEAVSIKEAQKILDMIKDDCLKNYKDYIYMINENPAKAAIGEHVPIDPSRPMIARELARMILSVNFYTQWYWKIDLHNLFNFLALRMDEHAQHEIRVYANAIAQIVSKVAPICYEAFQDYRLNSISLSSLDVEVISKLSKKNKLNADEIINSIFENKREADECREKLKRIGLLD